MIEVDTETQSQSRTADEPSWEDPSAALLSPISNRELPAMGELIPLRYLDSGQSAQIGQLIGHVDQVHRLEELGLRSGTSIEMLQPGSPCIIRVSGSKLCFRDCDSLNVLVRPGVPS